MQDIIAIRDRLREDITTLDGGFAAVARQLKKSTVHVHRTLRPQNKPRLETLEEIKEAYDTLKRKQDVRLTALGS